MILTCLAGEWNLVFHFVSDTQKRQSRAQMQTQHRGSAICVIFTIFLVQMRRSNTWLSAYNLVWQQTNSYCQQRESRTASGCCANTAEHKRLSVNHYKVCLYNPACMNYTGTIIQQFRQFRHCFTARISAKFHANQCERALL
jgi:hypothetical protein